MITTNRFFLRPLVAADVNENYVQWFSDDAAKRYITSAKKHQNLDTLRSYVSERENKEDILFLAIYTIVGQEHIGNIKYEPICSKTRTATVGILIGNKSWRSRGVATEVLKGCGDWLHKNRCIEHILLGVEKSNHAAITAYEKSGFRVLPKKDFPTHGSGGGLWMQRDYKSRH